MSQLLCKEKPMTILTLSVTLISISRIYILLGRKPDATLFCCSPWKKRWTGKGRPRSVARAARYPQTIDSHQIRWVSLFPASRLYIYIYIHISNLLLTTFYSRILSLLCISIHIYIPMYTYTIDNRCRLAHPQSSPRVARCGWDDDVLLRQVPPSCNCNYALRCIMYRITSLYYNQVTADRS